MHDQGRDNSSISKRQTQTMNWVLRLKPGVCSHLSPIRTSKVVYAKRIILHDFVLHRLNQYQQSYLLLLPLKQGFVEKCTTEDTPTWNLTFVHARARAAATMDKKKTSKNSYEMAVNKPHAKT